MSRRELKTLGAWVIVSSAVITGLRIGLELLGARTI
jgi:hypothetical protein